MFQDIAKEVFRIESKAIANLASQLTEDFDHAVDMILSTSGRVIVCGIGKSGIIGKKIAATLASTGTPSFFMHPGEAYHGDLGMVTMSDVFLAISNSGETDEILKLIPYLHGNKNKIISMTGNSESTLALHSSCHISIRVDREACPLQLAPTTSTTATAAVGDALAVSLMKARSFEPENFARFHPGGALGKSLLTKVKDVASWNVPTCSIQDDFSRVISVIMQGRVGACLVEGDGKQGVITDGDLRRVLMKCENPNLLTAKDIMSTSPVKILGEASLSEARGLMEERKITFLLVQGSRQVKKTGYVTIYDL